MYIYLYTYIYVCMYVYIYIYLYIFSFSLSTHIHTQTEKVSQFLQIEGSGTKYTGSTHPGVYVNELVIDEIRNNASCNFPKFSFCCCQTEFVQLW
jgi:hypothetical protein